MWKRRLSALLLCFCCLCCVLSGPVYAVGEVPNLDDILQGADPWEDFNNITGAFESMGPGDVGISAVESGEEVELSPEPVPDEEQASGEDVYGDDVGLYSLPFPPDLKKIKLQSTNPLYSVKESSTSNWRDYSFNRTFTKSDSNSYVISSNFGIAFRINSTYFDYSTLQLSTDVPLYSKSDGDFLHFKGNISAAFKAFDSDNSPFGSLCYASTVQLLVNGNPVGQAYPINGGSGVFLDGSISLADVGNIYTLGYRFKFNTFTWQDNNQFDITVKFLIGDSVIWETSKASVGDVISGVDDVKQEQEKTNGLLGSLIDLVKSIISGLGTIVQSIGNIVTAIAELPGKIWTAISDGLQLLFVPSTDEMDDLYRKFSTLMQNKLGFVYESFQLVENLFKTIHNGWSSHSDYTFDFPGIIIKGVDLNRPNREIVIAPKQTIDFNNAVFTTLRNTAGTLVSIVAVLACIHAFEKMFIAIISGANYFEYIREVPDEEENS